MSIQAQQVISSAARFPLGAAVSFFFIIATFAVLAGLAAAGVGLVEW